MYAVQKTSEDIYSETDTLNYQRTHRHICWELYTYCM